MSREHSQRTERLRAAREGEGRAQMEARAEGAREENEEGDGVELMQRERPPWRAQPRDKWLVNEAPRRRRSQAPRRARRSRSPSQRRRRAQKGSQKLDRAQRCAYQKANPGHQCQPRRTRKEEAPGTMRLRWLWKTRGMSPSPPTELCSCGGICWVLAERTQWTRTQWGYPGTSETTSKLRPVTWMKQTSYHVGELRATAVIHCGEGHSGPPRTPTTASCPADGGADR